MAALVVVPMLLVTTLEIYSMYQPGMDPIRFEEKKVGYWPTKGWRGSTPEQQGIDSKKLLEMADDYLTTHSDNPKIAIDSVTIIRNGFLVSEMYFNPLFSKETKHVVHSVTKSLVSTLIGIAVDKGYIESVDVPVIRFFDADSVNNLDPRWNDLTLKHLLSMQTGLRSRDNKLYRYEGLSAMQKSDDWVEYALNLRFEEDPGIRYEYSNISTFMLGAILKNASGKDTLEFAKEHLFTPLGIEEVQWEKSPKGYAKAWARMWLKPDDMAKIGLLYLQKGKWNNRQIVSTEWIDQTLTAHASPFRYRKVYDAKGEWNLMASGSDWVNNYFLKPFLDGYGYQWWLDKSGSFSAVGTGGQYIICNPEPNLIVVFTSKLHGGNAFFPERLYKKYILPSVVSDQPLPPNAAARKKLVALSETPESGRRISSARAVPPSAYGISGKRYRLAANYFKNDNLELDFVKGRNFARIGYTAKEGDRVGYRIGLDNNHRLTDSAGVTYASHGYWENDTVFIINTEIVGYSSQDKWKLTFTDNRVIVEEFGVVGIQKYEGVAEH